jgi:hypothetical protein
MKIEKVHIGCSLEYFENNLVLFYKTVIQRNLELGKKICFVFPTLHKSGKFYTGSIFPMDDGSIVFDLDLNK